MKDVETYDKNSVEAFRFRSNQAIQIITGMNSSLQSNPDSIEMAWIRAMLSSLCYSRQIMVARRPHWPSLR